MEPRLSPHIMTALACPGCLGPLEVGDRIRCGSCGSEYGFSASGAPDLRLTAPRTYSLEFEIPARNFPELHLDYQRLKPNPHPEINYQQLPVPDHLDRELVSYFPKPDGAGRLALDLGCGAGLNRKLLERIGYEYLGLDFANPRAPILADAHGLPIKDGSVDFVLSMAVLEHIQYPFVMVRETARVLKPGGKFIGTAAFLEPFHDSYYCFSHWGLVNLLKYGGFSIEVLAPSRGWSGLNALAKMSLFPKLPKRMVRMLTAPLQALHLLWWRSFFSRYNRRATESYRVRNTTGVFAFVAVKER